MEVRVMIGRVGDIEHPALEHERFGRGLFTGTHAQRTVMRLTELAG
jgi:hypothetical protein